MAADNIGNNSNFYSPPHSIRFGPEPVQIELESVDHSLLLTNLQTAFPHGTGIYYRPKGECGRIMLRFDGRRFLAPDGGWNVGSREYFVELGGDGSGGAKQTFPFGSYEQASRQFERSVNLVQQMMNGSMLKGKNGRRQRMTIDTSGGEGELTDGRKNAAAQNAIIDCMINKEVLPTTPIAAGTDENTFPTKPEPSLTTRSIKQWERDFADLASICAGKDIVIDGQRQAIDKMNMELASLRAEQTQWTQKEMEWNARLEAAQQELELLRELGKDQQEWHSQIVALNSQLEMAKAECTQCRVGLEETVKKLEAEAREWREKSELSAWTSNELTEQLRKVQREKAELQRKTSILEEQVNGEAMEFSRRFQERERMQRELLQDNTRLYQLKDQLELECREIRQRLETSNAEMQQKVKEVRAEYEASEIALRNGLEACEQKIVKLESEVAEERIAKEKALEQLERHKNHSELGKSDPLFAYSQP